jgi:hypothetical protein
MPYNAHKVFENQSVKPSFSKGIALPDIETNELRAARDVLRAAISGGLRNWASVVRRDDAFTEEVTLPEHYTLRPRFRMQGSHKYYTHIAPAHRPPQQADMDDGLFLPVLYFGELTDQRPALLSDAYFNLIETIIQPVCEERGWTLKKKSTCIRVELSDEQHVDMALYSIPERQLRTLTEEIAKRRDDVSFDTPVLDEEVYRSLASGEIMLAHREQGWKRSDPRKLEDWFQSAMDRHGSQLRRVCRYLKAWRDNVWQKGGPSSIALMYVAVAAYDQGEFEEGRDDKALLSVAEAMPGLHLRELSGRIPKNVDFHTYKDGSCCTGVWEVWTAANPGATISDYFEGPVRTYFISQILVYAGEKWPHGEYKHGLEGIFDAAAELLNTSDPDETLYTLHILAQSQPKGHWRCACLKQKPIHAVTTEFGLCTKSSHRHLTAQESFEATPRRRSSKSGFQCSLRSN